MNIMNKKPDKTKEQHDIEHAFHDKYEVGVGQEVTVKYDEHQFKTTDVGTIISIITEHIVHVKFKNKSGGGGSYHMLNLKIIENSSWHPDVDLI